MKRIANIIAAVTIVGAEVASVGLATTSASAQESTRQQVARQQRLILQQQRQILQNQRLLDAQNQRLASRHEAPAYTGDATTNAIAGLLGFSCPPHYYINRARGCLPDLDYVR